MSWREEVIYNLRLTGVPQVVADSKRSAAAIDDLKRKAASTSTNLPVGALASGASGRTTLNMLNPADRAAFKQMLAGEAAAAESAVAAVTAPAAVAERARHRPAFGERGFAVARAAGAGRYAALAGPFGGWGPLLGIGAGFTALSQVKASLQNIGLNQQLQAQTQAGIRSTGGAAGVTSKEIDRLSVSLGKLAGVQDETVHDSENILLTFANIRNEAGKGNKIFDQTSLAVANVAARMHTDMPNAALQLGKALNDPITGLGALRRIGVQFNQQQADQIKVMIASGNRLAAQKIILRELNVEFGGSAKAAGKTLPAAMVALQESWENARNKLVVGLLPALTSLTNWLAVEIPHAAKATEQAFDLFDNKKDRPGTISHWLNRMPGAGITVPIWQFGNQPLPNALGKINNVLPSFASKGLGEDLGLWGGQTKASKDAVGLAERRRQQAAVGGVMLDENGNPVRGMGGPPFPQREVRVTWGQTDPFDTRPVILVADSTQIAKVVTKAQQKRTHSEGRGTAHKP